MTPLTLNTSRTPAASAAFSPIAPAPDEIEHILLNMLEIWNHVNRLYDAVIEGVNKVDSVLIMSVLSAGLTLMYDVG